MSHLSPTNLPDSNDLSNSDDPYQFSFRNDDETPNFSAKSPQLYDTHDSARSPRSMMPGSIRDVNKNLEGYSNAQKDQQRKKVSTSVIIHIKLSDTITKEIRCNLEDNVLELANNFCQENNLSLQAVPVIINMIKQQFGILLQRMRENIKPQENSTSSEEKSYSDGPKYTSTRPAMLETQDNDTMKKNMGIRNNYDNGQKLVGKLEVAIGSTQKDLMLFVGEDPVKVAYQFCKENSLPLELVEVLAIKLEKIRRGYEQKKQQEHEQNTQKNPFKVDGNQDKDKLSTGSISFYQYGTAAFATEESDMSDIVENLETNRDEGESKQRITSPRGNEDSMRGAVRNKEHLEDKSRMKHSPLSFKEPNFEEDEAVHTRTKVSPRGGKPQGIQRAPIFMGNQNPQAKIDNGYVFDKDLDHSSLIGRERRLTKNQENSLLQRLYYDGATKESGTDEGRSTSRPHKRNEGIKQKTEDLNRSRSQKRSPPRDVKNMNSKDGKNVKLPTKENFSFQPKMSETASRRVIDPANRSRSPIYEKFSIEGLLNQHQDKSKQYGGIQKKQSPDRRDIENQVRKELESKLSKQGNRPEANNKIKPKYFQNAINPYKQYQETKTQQGKESKAGVGGMIRNENKDLAGDSRDTKTKIEYKEIFSKLDGDKDGYISAHKADLSQLPAKLVGALLDLVEMLEDTGIILDYKGFVGAVNDLNLEEKIMKALEHSKNFSTKNNFIEGPDSFFRKRSPRGHTDSNETLSPEFADEPNINFGKKLSKRSDISTASSNQTENSARSTNFPSELLDRKV